MAITSALPIDTSASAMDMANTMFGAGINVQSASYSGGSAASGTYSGGDAFAPQATPSDTGVILSTGRADAYTNESGDPNQAANTSHDIGAGVDHDADLDQIAGMNTYDGAIFESDFIPDGSTLTMQIQFASEEYLEFVNSGFNDAVGVWVNGEKADLTVGDGDITIDNINDTTNQNLYIDNPAGSDAVNTEMDGLTVTLTLKAPVNPGQTNAIKIGIADGGDSYYDSNLLIAGDSVQTSVVAHDDSVDLRAGSGKNLDVLANDQSHDAGSLTITAINGQAVVAGDKVVLQSGLEVELGADGTLAVLSEAESETVFTYEVSGDGGITDIGFVTAKTLPCFVAGTRIETADGPRPVEDIRVGDMIPTRDHGLQPVRWAGQRRVQATGSHAPVEISPGALGPHGRIALSPQHRVFLSGWRAELCCGTDEMLVKACHLVNDQTIRRLRSGGWVRYVHLLFDRHEIISAEGLESESFHPGPEVMGDMDAATRAELLTLFPGLASDYGPAARPEARAHEARLITLGWPVTC